MDKKRWQGIGASSGYGAGETWILPAGFPVSAEPPESTPGSLDIESQLARLAKAIEITDYDLAQFEEQVRSEKGEEVAQIFAAHRLLLGDPAFTGEMLLAIQNKRCLAEQAVRQVTHEAVTMLSALEDPYFRERVVDIQDVSRQLLQHLGAKGKEELQFPSAGHWVVVAEELTPALTISLPKDRVIAFIVRTGGKTSHAAILARTYGIPAVVGINSGWGELVEQPSVELDGDQGWISALSKADWEDLKSKQTARHSTEQVSPGGIPLGITLAANIGSPSDISHIHRFKAQGVGLYRTEFLFMADTLPTEEEQVEAYAEVIAACFPSLTVIRTLDIGGDKRAPALALSDEKNPFLGVRALRLCFKRPELFETQLRAIWRASAAGPTAVMFPMISSLEELVKAKEYLEEARKAVIRQGHAIGSLQVGMMIEVPAAVWLAGKLARMVDFFSIGTNDLIQYALAVDRENSEVADLYQVYHPAVLGMIAQVAWAAKQADIWIGICGEAGGDDRLAPFFMGLGIDELSMAPGVLPKMRKALAGVDKNQVIREGVVDRILDCATVAEVVKILEAYPK